MSQTRIALDTNIFDLIVADDVTLDLTLGAAERGQIEIIVTHIQEDELAGIDDAQKRERIARIPRTIVATHGFVFGTSRFDLARLSEPEPIEAVRRDNWPKYTNDALIAVTAANEADALVTEDQTLAKRVKAELGSTVWTWLEFNAHLCALARPP